MRTSTLAAGLIAVGTLAALPFRHTQAPIDPNPSDGIATGPWGHQMQFESIDSVIPWPSRPGYEPALPWQPQPITFDAVPPAFEMPPMPDSYPMDTIELPMPAPVRDRYDAIVNAGDSGVEQGLLMPQVVQIEDRFIYTPLPAPTKTYHSAKVQAASVISNETNSDAPPVSDAAPVGDAARVGRHFITEPR